MLMLKDFSPLFSPKFIFAFVELSADWFKKKIFFVKTCFIRLNLTKFLTLFLTLMQSYNFRLQSQRSGFTIHHFQWMNLMQSLRSVMSCPTTLGTSKQSSTVTSKILIYFLRFIIFKIFYIKMQMCFFLSIFVYYFYCPLFGLVTANRLLIWSMFVSD